MRMLPAEFFEYRLCYFFDALAGHLEEREERLRSQLEIARRMTTELVNIQVPEADRLTPNKLWPLPWDNESEPEVSAEEVRTHNKMLLDALKDFQNGRLG